MHPLKLSIEAHGGGMQLQYAPCWMVARSGWLELNASGKLFGLL